MEDCLEVLVKVVGMGEREFLPERSTEGSSGWDLMAAVHVDVVIHPMERAIVPTGIALSIPRGTEGQVRPRSGLALNYGVTIVNAPGTIDSDYRGEIKVILINFGKEKYTVKRGDRVAQIVFSKVQEVTVSPVPDLDSTERGSGGFGSTGT
jgi:dUTP pyrophosphatase